MADNGTVGRVHTMMCPRPAPEIPPGTPEMRAWDGVQRGSPAEEYLKSARGGMDPVRADSFHYQQALSLQDGIIGEVIGAGLGYVLKLGAKLLGAAKGVAKPAVAPKPTAGATKPVNGVVVAKLRQKISPEEHRAWLEKNGYRNVDDHVKSANSAKPVELVQFNKGDEISMYVRDGGTPGSYGTSSGTSPSSLAIDGTGRHLEVYVVDTPFTAIQSTAGPFPTGVYPGVGGPGGGVQYQLPSVWQNSVSKVPGS